VITSNQRHSYCSILSRHSRLQILLTNTQGSQNLALGLTLSAAPQPGECSRLICAAIQSARRWDNDM